MYLVLCHVLQVRILVGVWRETCERLHQGNGQQFDIDAGEACDNILVPQTRWLTLTLNATFNRDTFRANHELWFNTLRTNYSQ